MKKKKVSLKDIADALQVSQMTVSRALHGKGGLSEELQNLILQTAGEMNYLPSRAVKGFAETEGSLTVGVVVPHIANTIFPEIIENIESFLSANGYRILLCCSYNNPLKEFRDISALLERKVDGIIWSPVALDNGQNIAMLIRKQRCPLVFLDRVLEDVAADAVVVNDRESMHAVVTHLLQQGCRNPGYLNSRIQSSVSRERLAGYRQALGDFGLKADESLICHVGSDVGSGRSGVAALLERPDRPDAIVCFNDPLAIGVELELLGRQIAIPGEIAVTGFSGVVETELAAVPITTVQQHPTELGQEAARLLFGRMINPAFRVTPVKKVLPGTLVVRQSSLRSAALKTR